MKKLSIIIPMMNEEDGIDILFRRLIPIISGLELDYEIICVNDGSVDGTLSKLIEKRKSNCKIHIIDLSRNFGKEAALMAGIEHATGECLIPLDADLQDPPELIPEMIYKWQLGAEVVLAVRERRRSDSWIKRTSANMFYSTINKLSDIPIPSNAGDFRLIDRKVVFALRRLPERNRFNKGIFAWLGFKTEILTYERPEREAGQTKWKFRQLWSFALDGITSFSSWPLRVWSYIGLAIATASLMYALITVIRVIFFDDIHLPGYASIITAIMFSTGVILISLGVIAEYLSRIFIEVKSRPLYIIRDIYDQNSPSNTHD
ncbi:glycosyltransferase family 2 protein [Ochrobactrum soli]|uniref:Glycosyltransferase n=1 Tax=Ochrobactrum soli TaxID=2448455 RepID=A0A2P9HL23_9HYPH|nr:glycosyltransferase family 2 protein [[Ochrobactrum] soli]SPL64795.1 Glycosyltransferase [[Ochrobactrum] soli]